ncbi:MAG: hypothetical protein Kow0022_10600 [Phycisphaerales bacterium]
MLVALALGLASCSSTPGHRSAVPAQAAHPLPAQTTRWHPIGTSVRGRTIEAVALGHGRCCALIVGGIHGDEREPAPAVEALRRHLAVFVPGVRVVLIRDLNPDGSDAHTRGNANGVDLNRNWPAVSFRPSPGHGPAPLSEPETRTLAAQIERWSPDVIIVCHAAGDGPFVNFDGPAADLAERFAQAARTTDRRWTVRPYMGYETPGSLGSCFGLDRGLPILTIEFARGHEAELAKMALIDGVCAVLEAVSRADGSAAGSP